MAQFIVKGRVKYQGKLYVSGQVVDVAEKDVKEFKKHGWQLVKEGDNAGNKGEPKPDLSKLTNDQLKALLDEKGIAYAGNAKKADLLALLA